MFINLLAFLHLIDIQMRNIKCIIDFFNLQTNRKEKVNRNYCTFQQL